MGISRSGSWRGEGAWRLSLSLPIRPAQYFMQLQSLWRHSSWDSKGDSFALASAGTWAPSSVRTRKRHNVSSTTAHWHTHPYTSFYQVFSLFLSQSLILCLHTHTHTHTVVPVCIILVQVRRRRGHVLVFWQRALRCGKNVD
jgi:hypothetical protein